MFARKKPLDFQSSLQRFTDMTRDPLSRAKHFKIILDNLNPQEKRQVVEAFSFEIYHLMNALMISHYDLPIEPQTIADVESVLGMLEQVLLFAPEFVGKGWQRNGLEFIFKMVLHPKNAIAVRRLAIRLFIVWYQILATSGHTSRQLDLVFQCCLPHFPLHNGQSTEQILTIYCEGSEPNSPASSTNNVSAFEPCAAKSIPVLFQQQSSSSQPAKIGTRDRAEALQGYLDKFLEYNIRELVKINWSDPAQQRLDCAKFLLDRIVVLYIYELFPEAEANGIDVYDGWEGTFDDENAPLMDTADPIVIAKYWLIRWMTNIAFESQINCPQPTGKIASPGLTFFKQALFSSQKATNILLTLIREAFRLPLACINVIQKAMQLLRHWLLQEEIPAFVDSQLVSLEDWTLLLIHMLFSFFRSPYLASTGDKLPSAIAITHTILQIVRDLANPATILPNPLSTAVWQELLKELLTAVEFSLTKPDAFGKATAGGFSRTFLSVLIFVRVIREVDIADSIWDDLLVVFQNSAWPTQIMEQWSRIVPNLTRALILNLFKIEIGSQKGGGATDSEDSHSQQHASNSDLSRTGFCQQSRAERSSDSGSTCAAANLCEGMDEEEQLLTSSGGGGGGSTGECAEMMSLKQVPSGDNAAMWLRMWMRVCALADSTAAADRRRHHHSTQQLAVQTLGRAIDMLCSTGCANSLVHWLTIHLLGLNVAEQPHAIPIMCNVLILADPPRLERAHILHYLLECLRTDDASLVLEHIPLMNNLEDMAVISTETIATLQKLVKNQEFSSRAIRVAALLSLNHTEAEKILISLLEQRQVQIDQFSLALCVNALALLILERADAPLFDHLLHLLVNHPTAPRILPIFCANLGLVVRLGFHSQLMDSLLLAQSKVKNENALNDLKWQICAISSKESIAPHWRGLAEKFHASGDEFFEGFVTRLSGQFPLPGFQLTQWNSLPSAQEQQQTAAAAEETTHTFIETEGAILSVDRCNPQLLWSRTCLGKHAYAIESIQVGEEANCSVDDWLKTLADEHHFSSQFTASARKKSSFEEVFDPFKELPYPSFRPHAGSTSAATSAQKSAELIPLDISVPEMLQFIEASQRCPEDEVEEDEKEDEDEGKATIVRVEDGDGMETAEEEDVAWRPFLTSFGLLDGARLAPANFQRDIRHLDSTGCREVHKVAVIYVGREHQDKQTILSATSGSDNFNKFVDALGWPVQIGSPEFSGYTGGLPNGQLAPYYATTNTELIFHVATLLAGDTTQRLKHLGNDEVHVVWSENPKPYRRDLIATRFCDVLIVLYTASPVLLRVHIEVQDQRIQFGPLFDGACIHTHQAASLVRETVLNASRAYRNLKVECDRPNKHREKVFAETKRKLGHLPLSASITRLFAPPIG